jgi:hypothetical protein
MAVGDWTAAAHSHAHDPSHTARIGDRLRPKSRASYSPGPADALSRRQRLGLRAGQLKRQAVTVRRNSGADRSVCVRDYRVGSQRAITDRNCRSRMGPGCSPTGDMGGCRASKRRVSGGFRMLKAGPGCVTYEASRGGPGGVVRRV